MKLSEAKPYFESSGDLEEHFFSIQDQGMIFDILRSKMYSNPILAICREITSNARDAHREVGKPELPIQIHLPFGLEPEYRVKDFGPGISPDRMLNIFIKYTASTKRNDNVQTGGFGLGAKTPFSYSDTFLVTTVFNGIKYSYSCSIDETKVGKLLSLNKQPSNEPNSTEIIIPVKSIDFNFFRQWTEQACRHWTTKPIITGSHIDWQTFTKIIDGNGWAIANDGNGGYYNQNRTAKLVIDGIEYPLELDALRKYADPKLIEAARGTFIMYFGVGELSLSANREQIFLDKPTQNKIKSRLDEITKEIKKHVDEKIDTFSNLWEANVYYRKELTRAFTSLVFLGALSWRGHALSDGYLDVGCNVYTFQKGRYSRRLGNDPNRLTRSIGLNLDFSENNQLYINDISIKEPTPRHVKKAFEDDPKLSHIQVICPNDKQTETVLNQKLHLDLMAPKRLSSITKASGRSYTPSASRLLIFKFDNVNSAFCQVSYDIMAEDPNNKVICFLTRNNYPNIRLPSLSNNKMLQVSAFRSLLGRNPKTSFYGVDKETDKGRVEEEFSDFKRLDDFIDEKVLSNKSINYLEIKFSRSHRHEIDDRMLGYIDKVEPLILDKSSLFLMRIELHKKIKKLNEEDRGLLDIYESIKGEITDKELKKFAKDNPSWDIGKINAEYAATYSLLGAINTYNLAPIIKHMAYYINMVDKI